MKIAMEIGDRGAEGKGYGRFGISYQSLSDYGKSIEYHEKYLKLAIEIGEWGGEEAIEDSILLTSHSVSIANPLTTMRNI